MARAEFITYTDKEIEAIEILKAHQGEKLTAAELGISTAVLTSLIKKANDERPMAEGVDRFVLNKEDAVIQVTVDKNVKVYFM